MIDTVEIQLTMVLLAAERRVGEIEVIALADGEIAWGVEFLAFPLVRQHVDMAVFQIGAGHTAGVSFARVQSSLDIEGIAAGAVGRLAKIYRIAAGSPFPDLVGAGIAEDQNAVFRPGGAFGKDEVLADNLDGNLGEILGGRESQDRKSLPGGK